MTAILDISPFDTGRAEGTGGGTTPFNFIVERSGTLTSAASATWSVVGLGQDGATAEDFAGGVLPTGTVSFAAGDKSNQFVVVNVARDAVIEPDEDFIVVLADPSAGATIGTAAAVTTIVNDDFRYSLLDNKPVKYEGQSGTVAFTFTVQRTGDLTTSGIVRWNVLGLAGSGGRATDGADFVGGVLPSGVLVWPGPSTRQITVNVAADAVPESDEHFVVLLSESSGGGTLGVAAASATVLNDDVSLSIAPATVTLSEGSGGGTTNFAFTVTRSGALSNVFSSVSVNWSVAGVAGSGTSPVTAADFAGGVLPSGTVTFGWFETSKTILVPVLADATIESNERFAVTLDTPLGEGAIAIANASAEGVVLDDDAPPILSIGTNSASKPEGTGGTTAYTFTVTRGGNTTGANSATWTVSGIIGGGTLPAQASDFVGGVFPTGTFSFAAGETSKVISVNVVGDTQAELNERFAVTLSAPIAGASLGASVAQGIIINDDAALAIAATSASKPEGTGGTSNFTFTVTRTGYTGSAVSAVWAASGMTDKGTVPAQASDFAGGLFPTGTVSFAAGETSKVISVNVAGDTTFEFNESFAVTLSAPSVGASLGTSVAQGIISNDDVVAAPSLSIAATNATRLEGHSGTTPFSFTVTRSGDISGTSGASWSVAGATGVGTAPAAAADFAKVLLPSGTVSFAPGVTTATITVDVQGDASVEADDLFSVTLASPTGGATIATATALGVIQNDDASLSIAATSATKLEGSGGTSDFTFTVSRTGYTGSAVSAAWTVSGTDGGGTVPAQASDFAGGPFPTGIVSFAAGETSKVVTVKVAGDTLKELNERFAVTLSGATAGAILGTSLAQGIILNDDVVAAPSLAIAATDANRLEGNSGTTPFTFTVTRGGSTAAANSATWTVAGAAGAGTTLATAADFAKAAFPSGTVSFAPGVTSATITVDVLGDSVVEADDRFAVTLSSPTGGATIATATAQGVIQNDDATLSIDWAAGSKKARDEGGSGTTDYSFTVTRTGFTGSALSASWAVAGATFAGTVPAQASDFPGGVFPSGTVALAPGQTTAGITVPVAGDSTIELNERFAVTLSAPSAGASIDVAAVESIILNDDLPALSIAATKASAAEGDAGSTALTFTVTRSPAISGASSAKWAVTGSGANPASAADFLGGVLPAGTVSFAAGQASQTVTVAIAGDLLVEGNEGLTVTLANPVGATVKTASATGTILNDDFPIVSLLTNGGFETGDFAGWALNFTPPSNAALITTDRVNEGKYAVNFNYDSVPASAVLSQSFATIKGETYKVGFDFGVIALAGLNVSMTAEILGADGSTRIGLLDLPRSGTGPLYWEAATFDFVADGDAATVRFVDKTGASFAADPILDNVRVEGPANTLAISAVAPSVSEGSAGTTNVAFTVTRAGDLSTSQTVDWAVTPQNGGAPVPIGGNPPTDRAAVDSATGVLFFDRNSAPAAPAVATRWSIFAEQAGGQVRMLLYRDLGDTWAYIGGSAVETVATTGVNTFTLPTPAAVGPDTIIAFWYPPGTTSTISFDGIGTTLNNHEWPGNPITAADLDALYLGTIPELVGGSIYDGSAWDANPRTYSIQLLAEAPLPPVPVAGNPPIDRQFEDFGTGLMFVDRNSAPAAPTVASQWSIFAEQAGGQVQLLLYRDLGTTWSYIGESALETVATAGVNTFTLPTPLAIGPDTIIAFWYPPGAGSTISFDGFGTTVAINTWSTNPITAADLDARYKGTIPELVEGSTFDEGSWHVYSRTYSIQLLAATQADGADFVGGVRPSGTLTFAPGESARTILVPVAGDTAVEPTETFVVTLSNPSGNQVLVTPTATATIGNDDSPPAGPAPAAAFAAPLFAAPLFAAGALDLNDLLPGLPEAAKTMVAPMVASSVGSGGTTPAPIVGPFVDPPWDWQEARGFAEGALSF